MKTLVISRKVVIGFASLLATALCCQPASAWMHASGNAHSWSASDARGGTASGGDGSWNGSSPYNCPENASKPYSINNTVIST